MINDHLPNKASNFRRTLPIRTRDGCESDQKRSSCRCCLGGISPTISPISFTDDIRDQPSDVLLIRPNHNVLPMIP